MSTVSSSAIANGDALLESAVAGDRHATAQLWQAIWPELVAFVGGQLDRALQARIDAADVVQDAIADALAVFPAFAQWSFDAFRRWQLTVCRRRLIRLRRRYLNAQRRCVRRELGLDDPDAAIETSSAVFSEALCGDVNQCEGDGNLQTVMDQLGPGEREMIRLRFWENLKWKQIADQLGITPQAARKRVERALSRLRHFIAERGEFGPWRASSDKKTS